MTVFDIIDMPENMEGMRKLMKRLGSANASDNEIREALIVLVDSTIEYEHDEHEMRARFIRFEENQKSRVAQYALISGLSCIPLWYAGRYRGGSGLDILIKKTGEKRNDALVIYSSESETMAPKMDDASFFETELDEVLDICDDNQIRYVLVNPESDSIKIPVEMIKCALETFNDTSEYIDSVLEEGVPGEDLFPELLETMVHETMKITAADGTVYVGNVLPWRRDMPVMEQIMNVEALDGEILTGEIYRFRLQDIKSICLYLDDIPYAD
ncbi:MAG: hypothetical protein LUD50_05785 [Clostridia bacterium]|nr:hypothetical protein [Clostridia bacterium]